MEQENKPAASLIFIFGGSGDLNYRKLTPALFNLFLDGWMPQHYGIVGTGRSNYSNDSFRGHLLDGVQKFSRRKETDPSQWSSFAENISYWRMDLTQEKEYSHITDVIASSEKEWGEHPQVVFYLAVAPQLVPDIARKLGSLQICHESHNSRIVIEKPFGHDLESAHNLNALLGEMFQEEQIFRIDHYLGKETVQNILAFRFANTLFEPIWNRNFIDHIQITAAESVGLEGRSSYYERSGALRDMVQNHILQLLCMVAMEAPVSFEANEIRNKKVDVLKAMAPIPPDEVNEYAVRGQYQSGWMKGEKVKSYRSEDNVNPESRTETFAALKFYIDNWRWHGVPIYVRTGKYLHERATIITIQFRPAPHYAFPPEAADSWKPNRLTIGIQPEMDIRIRFQAKPPGQNMQLTPVDMIFNYERSFEEHSPEAYETLLLDVMRGDATLFMRADQVEAAWKVIMPVLTAWESRPPMDFPNYAPDSWGPEDAEALIARDGRNWITIPSLNKE